MLKKVFKVFLYVSFGAAIAFVIDSARQGDMIDRHAVSLSREGQQDKAILIQDVRGILGAAAAVALAGVDSESYELLRETAMRLAREVVEGRLSSSEAQTLILQKAAPYCLKENQSLLIRLRGYDEDWVRLGAMALLEVPIVEVKLRAAVLLSAAENPGKSDLSKALVDQLEKALPHAL